MIDNGLIEGLGESFFTFGVHRAGQTGAHKVGIVNLLGILLAQRSIGGIGLHKGINLSLSFKVGTHFLVNRGQSSDVVGRRLFLAAEVDVVIFRTIVEIVHCDIGIRQVLVGHAEEFLVVFVGLGSLEEHFDGTVVLLRVLQRGAVVGVVVARDFDAVGTVEEGVGILQGLIGALHIGQVVEGQTVPRSLAGIAGQTIFRQFEALFTLLVHPRSHCVVGDVLVFELGLIDFAVILDGFFQTI